MDRDYALLLLDIVQGEMIDVWADIEDRANYPRRDDFDNIEDYHDAVDDARIKALSELLTECITGVETEA